MSDPTVLPTARRYATVSIWLHWIIAALVLLNIALAITAGNVPRESAGAIMANHKSVGLTVLVLSLLRLGWRLGHGTPPLSDHLKPWEKTLARVTHTLFYVLMIGVPLLGWAMSSAGPRPLAWFGIPFPKLPVGEGVGDAAHAIHGPLGLSFLLLAALHIAGALKHQFVDKDHEFARMNPFARGQ